MAKHFWKNFVNLRATLPTKILTIPVSLAQMLAARVTVVFLNSFREKRLLSFVKVVYRRLEGSRAI